MLLILGKPWDNALYEFFHGSRHYSCDRPYAHLHHHRTRPDRHHHRLADHADGNLGGIGVALAIALESIFPPIPSEVILPLSGFTAARGTLSLPGAIIWATIGSVLGAWTLYGISRWVGLHRINLAADKIPGVSRKDVSKANDWFTKYGTWSVLIGRVIPVVRSLISIPAGFNRMNFLHFTGWTLLGSAVWNTILVSAGYLLGDQWCSIQGALGVFEDVVIAAVIVVIVWFVVRKVRTVIRNRKSADGNE